jgi:hypothetical protein
MSAHAESQFRRVRRNLSSEILKGINPLRLISTVIGWTNLGFAVWFGAAVIGGVLIAIANCFDRWRDPPESEVRRVVARYRVRYGEQTLLAIGDHAVAASFSPDARYKRFLKRVCGELLASSVTNPDCAIEP